MDKREGALQARAACTKAQAQKTLPAEHCEARKAGPGPRALGKVASESGDGFGGSGASVPERGEAWAWETWEAGAPVRDVWNRPGLERWQQIQKRVGEGKEGELTGG